MKNDLKIKRQYTTKMEKINIYANGQIYSIRSHQTNLIYIGSTCQPLHKRFYQHKKSNKYCSSNEIICFEDSYIELIENFPCNSKKELNRREGQHIRITDCVNRLIAGRTKQEWNNDNKDKIAKQRREYIEVNRDIINETRKEYVDANRDIINKKQREWREINKEKISEQRKKLYASKKS